MKLSDLYALKYFNKNTSWFEIVIDLIKVVDIKEAPVGCAYHFENGMKFDEGEVDELTHALFHDATISDQNTTTSNVSSSSLSHPQQTSSGAPPVEGEGVNPANLGQGITFEALNAQLTKHEGLLQNLSISISRSSPPPVLMNSTPLSASFNKEGTNDIPPLISQ